MNARSTRGVIYVLAAVAVISLLWLLLPQIAPTGFLNTILVWVFWISFVLLAIALFAYARRRPGTDEVEIEGPAFARFLFNNHSAGLFWLPIRVFLGVSWLLSGAAKFGNPAWTEGGTALRGFWTAAVQIPEAGRPAITYGWYRDFLNMLLEANAETWFSWVIILGEIAVGLGLIVGALTGIAAFFGAFMNMSFLLAGTASTNPIMFTMAIGLVLAWKVAGYYGLDRWLLPMLGTPWHPGAIVPRARSGPEPTSG